MSLNVIYYCTIYFYFIEAEIIIVQFMCSTVTLSCQLHPETITLVSICSAMLSVLIVDFLLPATSS